MVRGRAAASLVVVHAQMATALTASLAPVTSAVDRRASVAVASAPNDREETEEVLEPYIKAPGRKAAARSRARDSAAASLRRVEPEASSAYALPANRATGFILIPSAAPAGRLG